VLFFADLSKLDLLGYVFQGVGVGKLEDSRIQHFRVHSVDIDTHPAMPVMADGNALGEGLVHIEVQRRVLGVMVGRTVPEVVPLGSGDIIEQQTDDAALI
jgi:diacylglycerol kinase (ATP)